MTYIGTDIFLYVPIPSTHSLLEELTTYIKLNVIKFQIPFKCLTTSRLTSSSTKTNSTSPLPDLRVLHPSSPRGKSGPHPSFPPRSFPNPRNPLPDLESKSSHPIRRSLSSPPKPNLLPNRRKLPNPKKHPRQTRLKLPKPPQKPKFTPITTLHHGLQLDRQHNRQLRLQRCRAHHLGLCCHCRLLRW